MRTLIFILMGVLTSASVFATDVNRCTDIRTRKITLSSEPCDPKTQRLVTVYQQSELDKRLSTFNGAAFLQQQKQQASAPRPVHQQQQQQPPRQKVVDLSKPHRDKNRCIAINREKANIDSRQRAGYRAKQGEWYRERLRQLSDDFTFYQCSGFDS